MKGVNLGGWLVLEKWITPSVFKGTKAVDEHSLCTELASTELTKRLEKHRSTFITSTDFDWMKQKNIELLRIPVGYWLFSDEKPYRQCIIFLDFAFKEAEKRGLKVIIDMHGAAGSQNGKHHSGQAGPIKWAVLQNQQKTLTCLKRLAERYKASKSLWGIELLNEPSPEISKSVLIDFYQTAYKIIREQCDDDVAVIIHDQFKPHRWWNGLGAGYSNVVVDMHLYNVFGTKQQNRSAASILRTTRISWRLLIRAMSVRQRVMIGEWSTALGSKTSLSSLHYFGVQERIFSDAAANCYWTYKTEDQGRWNLRFVSNTLKK